MINFLHDKNVKELWGDPYSADNPDLAVKFYRKESFEILSEHKFCIDLTKVRTPQFLQKLEPLTECQYEVSI
jgi:hypothetical protein